MPIKLKKTNLMAFDDIVNDFRSWLELYENESQEEKKIILMTMDVYFSSGYIYSLSNDNYNPEKMATVLNLLLTILKDELCPQFVNLILRLLAYPIPLVECLLNVEFFELKENYCISNNLLAEYVITACNLCNSNLLHIYLKYQDINGFQDECIEAIKLCRHLNN
jgi:hypothetical protein